MDPRRLIIARLLRDIRNVLMRAYFPRNPRGGTLLQIINELVAAAHPLSASEISGRTGITRQTVLRRLDNLCDLRMVEKIGTRFRPIADAFMKGDHVARLQHLSRLVHEASKKLSNLDTTT